MAYLVFGTALAWQHQMNLLCREAMQVSSQIQPSLPRLKSRVREQPNQPNLDGLVFSLDEVHIGEVEGDNHEHHQVDIDAITLQEDIPRTTEDWYERFEYLGGREGGENAFIRGGEGGGMISDYGGEGGNMISALEEQMEEAGSLLLEEQKEIETGSLLLEEQMEETGSLLLEEREET